MRNKGITEESQKAILRTDIPLFLRFIKEKFLNQVTVQDVEDFMEYCLIERKNCPETLERKITSIRCFYKTLIRKDYITGCKNPFELIDKIKTRKKVRGHLSEDEVNKIIDYADSVNDLRGVALLNLLFSSGIRLTELYQLNRYSLDFVNLTFLVKGKGEKERICIFSTEAKDKIMAYLNSRQDDLNPLFISREHNRWSKKAIENYVKRTAKLVSELLDEFNLTLIDVKQHNWFSGKDCPQVMRSQNRWNEFLELVSLEYFAKTKLEGVNFIWESLSPSILDNTG
jgi:integrase/recombinase XerD